MTHPLKAFLDGIGAIPTEKWNLLESLLIEKHLPAKTVIYSPGTVADAYYFVVQGAFRSYLLRDGNDITDYFFFEHRFATDYASMYAQQPSLFYLETIEDSHCIQIPWQAFQALMQQDGYWANFGRVYAQMAFVEMEERTRLLHHENLETRFRWMMKQFPEVFQRVPQYHIASYLGVKPESLSRIKRQIGVS